MTLFLLVHCQFWEYVWIWIVNRCQLSPSFFILSFVSLEFDHIMSETIVFIVTKWNWRNLNILEKPIFNLFEHMTYRFFHQIKLNSHYQVFIFIRIRKVCPTNIPPICIAEMYTINGKRTWKKRNAIGKAIDLFDRNEDQ